MGDTMWNDFSDYELATLAGQYGLEDSLVFTDRLQLVNRDEIEDLLTKAEHDLAFPVDFYSDLAYN
jgi:uncharacterized protein YlaN (UPF0358 family)